MSSRECNTFNQSLIKNSWERTQHGKHTSAHFKDSTRVKCTSCLSFLSLRVTPTHAYTTGRHMTTFLTHPHSGPSFAYTFASQIRLCIPCVSPGGEVSKFMFHQHIPVHALLNPTQILVLIHMQSVPGIRSGHIVHLRVHPP